MATDPIHLHIADVLTAVPANIGVEAGMVVLTEDEAPYRSLRIIIGQPEANAIHAGWHGAVPGRPSTWDLFVSTVALLEGRLDRVVITAVHEERHYFAHIELEQGGERRILACRPSDAIALAVRGYNVDILAEPSVLDAAGVMPDGTKPGPVTTPGDEPASLLAEREAALAAREAELAERERLIAVREHDTQVTGEPPAAPASEEQATSSVGDAPQPAVQEEAPADAGSGGGALGAALGVPVAEALTPPQGPQTDTVEGQPNLGETGSVPVPEPAVGGAEHGHPDVGR